MQSPIRPLHIVRRGLTLSTILALALSLGVDQAAMASTQQMQESTVHQLGWADPHVATMIESSSQALVDVLGRADQALKAQEPKLAADNLSYADKLSHAIELQMPFVVMKDRLETAKGKLEAGATHEFVDDLAPVYASIDDLVVVSPETGKRLHGKVKSAEKLAKEGKNKVALGQVDDVVNDLVSTRIYIPILYVQSQIDAARKALSHGDIVSASTSVNKSLGSLVALGNADISGGKIDIQPPQSGK